MKAKERLHHVEEELRREREKNREANKEITWLHGIMKQRKRQSLEATDEVGRLLYAAYCDIAMRYGTEIQDGYKELSFKTMPVSELQKWEILTARSKDGILTIRVRPKAEKGEKEEKTDGEKEETAGPEEGNEPVSEGPARNGDC